MRPILSITLFLLLTTVGFSAGVNGDSMINPDSEPKYQSCRDLLQYRIQKPRLTDIYTATNPDTGEPSYAIKGPTEIDVASGTVIYPIVSSFSGTAGDTMSYRNEFCGKPPKDTLVEAIRVNTAAVDDEVNRAMNNIDGLFEKKFDEENTTSNQIQKAVSMTVDNSSVSGPMLGFFASTSEIYATMQTMALCVALILAMLEMGGVFFSRKILNLNDNENYLSRTFLGVIILLMFYGTANTTNYNGGSISQTHYQVVWNWLLNNGSKWANTAAGAAHKQEMKSAVQKNGGGEAKAKIAEATTQKAILVNQREVYHSLVVECMQTYRIQEIRLELAQGGVSQNAYFPESLDAIGKSTAYKRYLRDEVDQNDVFLSLTTCGKAESEYRAIVAKLDALNETILNGQKTQYADKHKNNNIEFVGGLNNAGWISIAMLPVHHFMAHNVASNIEKTLHPMETKAKDKKPPECGMDMGCWLKSIWEALIPDAVKEIVALGFGDLSFDDILSAYGQKAALLVVPGVADLQHIVAEGVKGVFGASAPLSGLVGSIIGFMVATDFGVIVIQNLPFLVIVPVVSIAIAFYYAEVLFYTITIPFMVVFAFAQDQWKMTIRYIGRGAMVALKPVMLVISAYVAVYVAGVVQSTTNSLIKSQTAALLKDYESKAANNMPLTELTKVAFGAIKGSKSSTVGEATLLTGAVTPYVGVAMGATYAKEGGTYFLGKFTIFILQGLLNIITAVVTVFIVIKLIVSGPSMIMEIFGHREVDLASQMSESVASKAQKYEQGI